VARSPLGIRILLHALLLLAAVLTLAPYAWMVSSSFKPHAEIFSATLELVPRRPIVDNYVVAVTREPTLRAIGNSLVMAGAETLAVVATSVLTAYPFARLRFRGRDAVFMADNVRTRKISPQKSYTDVEAWNDWGTRKVGSALLYPVFTANILATRVRSMTAPPPRKVKRGAHFAGNYWCISALSRNKEAVAKFCQWWVQPAVSGRWAGESGAIPNSQAAADHPAYREFLAQNPLGQAFLDTIPDARPFPGVVGLPAVLQIVSEMVEAAVVGGVPPKEALEKAAARADVELKRAQRA
jgi:hypothetical protein